MLILDIKTFYILEGAPELWCLGTRILVPQMFPTGYCPIY